MLMSQESWYSQRQQESICVFPTSWNIDQRHIIRYILSVTLCSNKLVWADIYYSQTLVHIIIPTEGSFSIQELYNKTYIQKSYHLGDPTSLFCYIRVKIGTGGDWVTSASRHHLAYTVSTYMNFTSNLQTTDFNIKNLHLLILCIYNFRIIPRIKSDYFP